MPIVRTPQIDDDGSGTTGTIWNNAWKQELYNQIDALGADAGTRLIWDGTSVGTVNDYPLGAPCQHLIVRFYTSAALTVTGCKTTSTPRDGDLLTISNTQCPNPLYLANNSTGSTAGYRLNNLAISAPTAIIGGSATYYYHALSACWLMLSHEQGYWITPAYNAADYVGWTVAAGGVTHCAYYLQGRSLHWTLTASGPQPTATAVVNRVIPGGFTISGAQAGVFPVTGWGVDGLGAIYPAIHHGSNLITIVHDPYGGAYTGTVTINASGVCQIS